MCTILAQQNSNQKGCIVSNPFFSSQLMMVNEDIFIPNIAALDEQAVQAQSDDEESADSSTNPKTKLVNWRGNLVPEKVAKGLCHVFDDLQDHFGLQKPDPRVRFHASLANPGHGQTWKGDLDFTYDINGDHCTLAYIGMDVCVDLTPKLVHKYSKPILKDYGNSWLYVYLPQVTMDKFKSYVKTGTGWGVSDEGTIEDPNRDLVAIEAKLHHQSGESRPSFWVVKDKDTHGGGISFSRIGSIQEVSAQSYHQRMHRGVGIFSVSMEVEGTPNFKPTPFAGDEANLCFTLVSVRTWGITDCVAPIVHAAVANGRNLK
jgi:hypothetical protein